MVCTAAVLAAAWYIPGLREWWSVSVIDPLPIRIPPELTEAEVLPAGPGALSGCNLLLVTLDTTRADRIGCYGHDGIETPTLDGLAREGVLFSRAVTPVPLTTPAHSSILTGLYPYRHGVRTNGPFRLSETQETLAEILAARGYATGAMISAFVLDARFGLAQGFDDYEDDMGVDEAGDGEEEDQDQDKLGLDADRRIWINIPERPAERTTELAIAWLSEHQAERFFLWVHYFDPHTPYEPPSPYDKQYAKIPYDGEIAFVDRQFADLLGVLEELGLTDDTLVVVAGDHGQGLGQHGEQAHGYLVYESTMQVPMLMYCGRRLGGGVHIARPVSLVDIVPTVLSLLGIDWTGQTDGVDLTQPSDESRLIYGDTLHGLIQYGYAPLLALYDGPLKYIHGPDPELYDLSQDPFEEQNLLASLPGVATDMMVRASEVLGIDPKEAATAQPTVELSPGELAKLESLGYVDGNLGGGSSSVCPPDPKKMIMQSQELDTAVRQIPEIGLDAAIALIKGIVRKYPDFEAAHYRLALCYGQKGDLERFEEGLLRAREHYPDAPGALRNLARLRQYQGDDQEALALFGQLLSRHPNNWGVLCEYADLLLTQGRFNEAVEPLKKAFEIQPRNDSVRKRLIRAMTASFRTDEAIGLLRASLTTHPKLAGVRGSLCELLVKRERYAEAVTSLRAGLRVAPQNQKLAHKLADVLATCPLDRIRRPAEAVAVMEHLCEATENERPEYLLTLSVAYMSAQQVEQAIAAAQEALRVASASGRDELAQSIADRLESFKAARDREAATTPDAPSTSGTGAEPGGR